MADSGSESSSRVSRLEGARSALNPFRSRAFSVIWTATVVANIGAWMYTAAAGWLMTSMTSNSLLVSMVQVADSLPMLLLAIPAGALAISSIGDCCCSLPKFALLYFH